MKENRLSKIYDIVDQYNKFADTKAASLLALNTALMAFTGAVFAISASKQQNGEILLYLVVTSVFGVLLSGISIYFALNCLRPTLRFSGRPSLIYFGNISNYYDQDEFSKAVKYVIETEEQFSSALEEQIWVISKIASNKHVSIQKSVDLLKFSLVFYIIGVLGILFYKTLGL